MARQLKHLSPLALLDRLRSTYWFLPAIVTSLAVGLGTLLVWVDRWYPEATSWLGWAYGGGADGARALLSAVAGSTITVVSVTFSVMVVALTVSSQHFGPRLLNSFMRDNASQLVLGTFTGTFAYCLVVLRTVQGEGGDRYSVFVPHLAVTVAVVLTLVSVGMLIYYVHHVASSMQVSEITAGVARDLERTIARIYPDTIGDDTEPPAREPPPVPADAVAVASRKSGYIQEIDEPQVLTLAAGHETTVWLTARPGDFVVEGSAMAMAHPPPRDADAFAKEMVGAYIISTDRTSYQDAAFAVQQLVEVALRALSPGMNEPFTALTCIDRLGQGLSKLACRRIPSAVRAGEDGAVRAITRPRTLAELVRTAFEPIALYSGCNPDIGARLLETLARLAGIARRQEDRVAIGRVAEFVWTSTARQLENEDHRALLARRHEQVTRLLGGRATPREARAS